MNQSTYKPSILTSLRHLIPNRDCGDDELRQIAEAQANRLLELIRQADPGMDGITASHITGLPRIRVVYDRLPVSGLSHWNGQEWIIALNREDSENRQRFTLLHEFKHIIDHGATGRLYRDTRTDRRTTTTRQHAERMADYFPACALIPRRDLKRAWGNRLQRVDQLAEHFGVSLTAMEVRLHQAGLSRAIDPEPEAPPRARCARPVSTPWGQPQRFRTEVLNQTKRSYA